MNDAFRMGCVPRPPFRWLSQAPVQLIHKCLAEEWGLAPVDLGQGRGGECQFLAVLFQAYPGAVQRKSGRWEVDVAALDHLRNEIALWLENHAKSDWGGGNRQTLRELAVEVFRGVTRSSALEGRIWTFYLQQVRSEGWGDNFTLLAASAVIGRPIVVCSYNPTTGTSCAHEVAPPEEWDGPLGAEAPIYLLHVAEHHFVPLVHISLGQLAPHTTSEEGTWSLGANQLSPLHRTHRNCVCGRGYRTPVRRRRYARFLPQPSTHQSPCAVPHHSIILCDTRLVPSRVPRRLRTNMTCECSASPPHSAREEKSSRRGNLKQVGRAATEPGRKEPRRVRGL